MHAKSKSSSKRKTRLQNEDVCTTRFFDAHMFSKKFEMKRTIKKILTHLPSFLSEYFEWIFSDAAENQIRLFRTQKNKFRSYTQLKKHQKKIKIFVAGFFLAMFFLLVGLTVGPIFFPERIETELYIPNGRGDILLGNVSKNQVTVIFKTLDGANGNMPLATKAIVEVFSDENYTKLARRTVADDYAVTHIIPVDSLQEGEIYYIRVTAEDAALPAHVKSVSSWGEENDPIKVYTTGNLITNCASPDDEQNSTDKNISGEKNEQSVASIPKSTEYANNEDNAGQSDDASLFILNVMKENYLQPKNKVQTIISWSTSNPATAVLVYRGGDLEGKKEVIIDEQMQSKHAAILTTLSAGMTYYFQVKSVDENGNVAISEEYSLKTPRPQSTIVEKISENFMSIFKQIKPN